jgi:hypothetical protein
VVDDKVYTLNISDQAALEELNKLAWEQAKVAGTANGDTISVKSVTAAPRREHCGGLFNRSIGAPADSISLERFRFVPVLP